jgi:ubiquitin C
MSRELRLTYKVGTARTTKFMSVTPGLTVREVIDLISSIEGDDLDQVTLDDSILATDDCFDDHFESESQLFVFSKDPNLDYQPDPILTRLPSKWLRDFRRMKKLQRIGTGSSGAVFLVEDPVNHEQIALKVFDKRATSDVFFREADSLVRLMHPCILRLVGYSLPTGRSPAMIGSRYATNGSLRRALDSSPPPSFMNETAVAIIISGIAVGMKFIHANGAIHGDLKPSNVLLDAHGYPHIGDLGGCVCRDLDVTLTSLVGTPLYMAPEMYHGTDYTCAVDVYAFALICYEILVGMFPFPRTMSLPVFMRQIATSVRPKLPLALDRSCRRMIKRCWSSEPALRPSFDDIFEFLVKINFKLTPAVDSDKVLDFLAVAGSQMSPVIVRDRFANTLFLLDVAKADRVGYIQKKIEESDGIVATRQRISLGNDLLAACDTLQQHQIHQYSVLDLSYGPPETDSMQVFVRTLTGKHIVLRVRPTDRIDDIKMSLAAREGIPAGHQWLLSAGRQLEDGNTLADYSIGNNATLQLNVRVGNSLPQIAVKTEGNQTLSFLLQQTDRISDLKAAIYKCYGILPDRQQISSSRRPLNDDDSLHDCSSVRLVVIRNRPLRCLFPIEVVVTIQEGVRLPVNIDLTDRIMDIKVKLEELQPIRATCQCLFHNGRELSDRKTVSQSNVRKNAVLHLADHRNAEVRIFVRRINGMTFPITVVPQATVADIKAAIQLQHGIPAGNQVLVLAGRSLKDAKRLHECGIWGNTTLHLLVRSVRFSVVVKAVTGSTWTVIVDPHENVAHLKRRIALVSGVLARSQSLVTVGRELRDDECILLCMPCTGAIVYLVVRS